MNYLKEYGRVTGIDFQPYALQLSQKKGVTRVACASVTALPFESASFDLVTSIDVLTMMSGEEDVKALQESARVLVPGGLLYVRNPAYNWLRGIHDRTWDVCHRYTLHELKAKIERAGFLVEHASYANMWLLPVAIAKRLLEPVLLQQDGSDLTLNVGPFNGSLKSILASEAPLIAKHCLPFGLSVVFMARKP